jgi:hypothetical protein
VTPQDSTASDTFSLRLLDVSTSVPLAAVPVEVRGAAPDQPALVLHSDDAGILAVPSPGPVSLVVLEERLHLVFPEARYGPPKAADGIQSVLLYSTITVRGWIRYEDPSRVTEACPARIVAGPIRHAPGEVDSDEKVVGSPAWLLVNARNLHQLRTSTVTREFAIELPAIGEVGVCVAAPGHLPDLKTLVAPYPVENGAVTLSFDLRLGERLGATVLDEEKAAVQGARVQLIARRQVPYGELHFEAESLIGEASQSGTAIRTNGRETADIKHLAFARTDASGKAQRDQPGRADELYLVVLASGYQACVMKLERRGGFDGCTIVLKRNTPTHESYDLQFQGKPVGRGSLVLALRIDGMTPALPTLPVRRGRVSSKWIEPGREYVFFLSSESLPRILNGIIVFGEESTVELANFAKD